MFFTVYIAADYQKTLTAQYQRFLFASLSGLLLKLPNQRLLSITHYVLTAKE
jgi:hypothetical protein